jgi:hypothetical protein
MIYVFGDSFAEPYDNIDWTWTQLVSQKLKQKCTNFGQGGTGLEYTFEKFEQCRSFISADDDVVVCLTTEIRGYWYTYNPTFESFESIGVTQNFRDLSKNEYLALKYYFACFADIHIQKMSVNLCKFLHSVDSLAQVFGKKFVVIDAELDTVIENSRYPNLIISHGKLIHVSRNECSGIGYNKIIANERRPNHLCASNHAILADKIVACITTNSPLDLTDTFNQNIIASEIYDPSVL